MGDTDVGALIDRIVADARIPSPRERADLRRELQTHFEDAARAHGSIADAIAGFGSAGDVAERLRGVYRVQRLLVHAIRIAVGLAASIGAALAIELAASRPGAFRNTAALACLIVVGLVIAHEIAGTRLRRSTRAAKLARWTGGFLALAGWQYGVHHYIGVPFSAMRAAAAGGVLVTVAVSTAVILAGADRAFMPFVHSPDA